MSGALERFEPVDAALDLPWWELLPKVAAIVDVVVRTPFVGAGLRGNAASATAAVMFGHELGLGPMTSLNKLHVVDGSVSPSAELARALAMRAGEVWVEAESDERCEVAARRNGSDVVHHCVWTIADARRAGLLNKANWRSYPRQMLYARATSEIVRRVFPDVLGGITRTAEELDDEQPDVQVTQQPALPVRRARRPARSIDTDEVSRNEPQTAPESPQSAASVEAAHSSHLDEPEAESESGPVVEIEPAPAPRLTRLTHPSNGGRAPASTQLKRLRILCRADELQLDKDRPAKIELVSSIIGREIESTNDLDADEASTVIDALQAVVDGTGHLGTTEAGRLCVIETKQ